jgi:hypothetical protein
MCATPSASDLEIQMQTIYSVFIVYSLDVCVAVAEVYATIPTLHGATRANTHTVCLIGDILQLHNLPIYSLVHKMV